jgi:RNA polymerase sigma-70 factor (ECF subfamily)
MSQKDRQQRNAVGPQERISAMPSDAELVSLSLVEGGRDAFSTLVRRYVGMVMARLIGILNDYHDAEDLAQEVFLKAYRSLSQLRNHERFASWLMSIATNTALRYSSKRRPVAISDEDRERLQASNRTGEERTPYHDLARREYHASVLDAVEKLPEGYRRSVYLRYLKGYSCREIAEIEGVAVGVITSRLSRAYEMLRKKLVPVLKEGGAL